MEMADLFSYDSHELLRRRLLTALTKEHPKGFLAVDLEQIIRADQHWSWG